MNESVFARFVTIITDPVATMNVVRENPRWAAAALGVVLLVAVYSGATMHISGPEQVDMMQDTRFGEMMGPEQIEEMYARYDDITFTDRVVTGMTSGFGTLFALLVITVVYMLFGKLAGGSGSFRQVLGVTMWASFVGMGLSALVKLPIVLSKGSSFDVSLGPAILVAERGVTDVLFQLLSLFDLFSIWAVVLVVLGFESVHGFARNKAVTVVVGAYLLMNLTMFGIGRLFI